MKISTFFIEDYVDQASYDNLRKIASVVDGQKNAARKILYTVLDKNIKERIKVNQLGAKTAEHAEYLHGNLDGVITNLGQSYTGTNNIPLLQKKGNFGTRFSPEPSASRYIFASGSDVFFKLFKSEDNAILKHQTFEGKKIEPVFFVPTLPMLLVNGSEGVSSGFAQKILSRNPKDIKKYILEKLANKKSNTKLIPYFEGFTGEIRQGETSDQWEIRGKITRDSASTVTIHDVPVNYSLKKYLAVLDDLEDNGTIVSYTDMAEDDVFKFKVKFKIKDLKKLSDNDVLKKLKLIKKVTENFTVLDENNKIRVFNTINDVIDYYIVVKLEYISKRKEHILEELASDLTLDQSRYEFVRRIVDDELIINRRKKADIQSELDTIPSILTQSGSEKSTVTDNYDYLLNMGIMSLTEERLQKIKNKIDSTIKEITELRSKELESIWLEDLREI